MGEGMSEIWGWRTLYYDLQKIHDKTVDRADKAEADCKMLMKYIDDAKKEAQVRGRVTGEPLADWIASLPENPWEGSEDSKSEWFARGVLYGVQQAQAMRPFRDLSQLVDEKRAELSRILGEEGSHNG